MSSNEHYGQNERILTNENTDTDVQTNFSTARTFNQKLKLSFPNDVYLSPSVKQLDKDTLYDAFLLFQNFLEINQKEDETKSQNKISQQESPKSKESLVINKENKENISTNTSQKIKNFKNYDDIPAIGHTKNFIELVEETLANEPSANPINYHASTRSFKREILSKKNYQNDKLSSKRYGKQFTFGREIFSNNNNPNKSKFDDSSKKDSNKKNYKFSSKSQMKSSSTKKKLDKTTSFNKSEKSRLFTNYKTLSKQLHKSNTNDGKFCSKTYRYPDLNSDKIITNSTKTNKKKYMANLNFANINENVDNNDESNIDVCQSENANDKISDFKILSEKLEEDPKERLSAKFPSNENKDMLKKSEKLYEEISEIENDNNEEEDEKKDIESKIEIENKEKSQLFEEEPKIRESSMDSDSSAKILENLKNIRTEKEEETKPNRSLKKKQIGISIANSNIINKTEKIKKQSSTELDEDLNLNFKSGIEKKKILLDKERQLDSLKKDYERLNKQLLDGMEQFNQAKNIFQIWKNNEIQKINEEKQALEEKTQKFEENKNEYELLQKTSKAQEEKINALNKQIATLKKDFTTKENFYKKTIEELKELLNDFSEKTTEIQQKTNLLNSQPSFTLRKSTNTGKLTKSKTTQRIIVNNNKNTEKLTKPTISVIRNPINNKLIKPKNESRNVKTNKPSSSASSSKGKNESTNFKPSIPVHKLDNLKTYDLEINDKYTNNKSECIKEEKSQDGKVIKIFADDHKEIVFASGVKKKIFSDGYQLVYFPNGDIKQILSDGRIIYFFKEKNTTQTTYKDGLVVYKFPNHQVEKHFPDGSKEIYWENGTVKVIGPNGQEKIYYPKNDNEETCEYFFNEDEPVQESISDNLSYYKLSESSYVRK